MEDVFQGWNLRMSPFPLLLASEEEPPPARSCPSSALCALPFSPLCRRIASRTPPLPPPSLRLLPQPGGYQVCFRGEGSAEAGTREEETSLGSLARQDGDQGLREVVKGARNGKRGVRKSKKQNELVPFPSRTLIYRPSAPARCCPLTPHL